MSVGCCALCVVLVSMCVNPNVIPLSGNISHWTGETSSTYIAQQPTHISHLLCQPRILMPYPKGAVCSPSVQTRPLSRKPLAGHRPRLQWYNCRFHKSKVQTGVSLE